MAARGGVERNTPGAGFSDLLSLQAVVKGSSRIQVPPVSSLEDLNLDATLENNVRTVIKNLTPIQRYAMPAIMQNVNALCCSYTGSGKTAAFLVPILDNTIKKFNLRRKIGFPVKPLVLILAPTRELAIQIVDEAKDYCRDTPLDYSIHLVCGGKNMEQERKRFQTIPCNIIVATIGRLTDLHSQGVIDFNEVEYFVLDEADVMMEKGFYFDVLDFAKICKTNRVSVMFSATFPNAVRKAAEAILGASFVEIQVGEDGPTASKTITQEFDIVEHSEKNYKLKTLLESRSPTDRILIFGSSILDVERIHQFLTGPDIGYTASLIHSELETQRQREFALNEFKRKNVQILVATSVAARGLDIPDVDLVINYDLPTDIEEYILRIGRTGRVGNSGMSMSFFEVERDGPMADKLILSLRRAKQPVPSWLQEIKKQYEAATLELYDAYDLGDFSVKTRTFNSIGSSVIGIPCPSEVEDDSWD